MTRRAQAHFASPGRCNSVNKFVKLKLRLLCDDFAYIYTSLKAKHYYGFAAEIRLIKITHFCLIYDVDAHTIISFKI